MKKHSVAEHIRVYNEIFGYLKNGDYARPSTKWIMNVHKNRRTSSFIKKNRLELVPPHDHRTNPAEKCIDTFKCHLISGLSAMDPNFPLQIWSCILP